MDINKFIQLAGRIDRNPRLSTKARARVLGKLVNDSRARYIIAHAKIVGFRLPTGEVVCRKRRYVSRASADADLARIHATAVNKHIPVRAYRCPHCDGHHLTSASDRKM